MENSKSKLSPQEVFNNKKLFSNKIHARVLKVTEKILKSFDQIKIGDEDKNLLLSSINHYYYDLSLAIFHLRQVVIQIGDDDKKTVSDLQEVVNGLNKIVPVVQELQNLETEKLLIQLKGTISDIGPQVEKLMKIIEFDDLHDHKQKILDIQHDIVLSVEALKLYCQFTYLSISELAGILHGEIEKMKNNLIQIKTGHEHLTEDFSHYTRHSAQNLQKLVDYMQKQINTERLPPDVANAVKNTVGYGISYINGILECIYEDNPISKMLSVVENCHDNVTKASVAFQSGLQSVVPTNGGRMTNQKVQQLFVYIFINGINAVSGLNQSIEDAILQK